MHQVKHTFIVKFQIDKRKEKKKERKKFSNCIMFIDEKFTVIVLNPIKLKCSSGLRSTDLSL